MMKSIPTATPRLLGDVIQLLRRLQSAFKLNDGKGLGTDEELPLRGASFIN